VLVSSRDGAQNRMFHHFRVAPEHDKTPVS
jgi:hypothetical protein